MNLVKIKERISKKKDCRIVEDDGTTRLETRNESIVEYSDGDIMYTKNNTDKFWGNYLAVRYDANKSLIEVFSYGIVRDMMLACSLFSIKEAVELESNKVNFVLKDGKWLENSAVLRELTPAVVKTLERRYGQKRSLADYVAASLTGLEHYI